MSAANEASFTHSVLEFLDMADGKVQVFGRDMSDLTAEQIVSLIRAAAEREGLR